MPPGLRLLGPEGGAEGVDVAEGHGRGFVVELAGLRQVDLLVVEVVDLEQGGGALAGGGREDGRVEQRETVGVEVVADGADHLVADPQDGVLAPAAQPQVPVVHQEVDAVVLGRDGVRIGLRNALDHLQVLDIQLVAARRAGFGADLAGDDDRRFLGQVLDRLEQRSRATGS